MSKKIIDSFIFYNELNLLNMRLHELHNEVDYFILVESRKDFWNVSKDLYYDQNKEKFAKFNDKIIHVIVDELPTSVPIPGSDTLIEDSNEEYGMWLRENFLRNKIMEGVNRLELSDEDIIIISNVDEIPKPKSLRELREEPTIKEARVFKQMAFYYNFSHYESNCRGSMIIPFSLLRKRPPQFFKTRRPTLKSVSNGGWHCLFFGSSESVLDRIQTSPWYPAYKVTVGFDTGTANEGKDTGLPTSKDTVEERILLYQDVLGRRDRSLKDLRRVSHEDLPENKDLLYGNV